MNLKDCDLLRDYYILKKTNREIFDTHDLERKHTQLTSDLIYKRFPKYEQNSLVCEYCNCALVSSFLSKSAKLGKPQFEFGLRSKGLVQIGVVGSKSPLNVKFKAKAYLTDEGYKVGFPYCEKCDHRPTRFCECSKCTEIRTLNYLKLSGLTSSMVSRLSLDLFKSSCFEMWCLARLVRALLRNRCLNSFRLHHQMFIHKEALVNLGVLTHSSDWLKQSIKIHSIFEYSFIHSEILYSLLSRERLKKLNLEMLHCRDVRMKEREFLAEVNSLWLELALDEALLVAKFYSKKHGVMFNQSEELEHLLEVSLRRFGLSYTCRYICNSIRRARISYDEGVYKVTNVWSEVMKNIRFWVVDQRARSFFVKPFIRNSSLLLETREVRVFSEFFLEPSSVDYFNDRVSTRLLV